MQSKAFIALAMLDLAETESERTLHHSPSAIIIIIYLEGGEEEVCQNTSDAPLRVERERRGDLPIFSDQQR
ncbi:hypothetical protein ROHU_021312 [Labeo rohita]|uniref:Uncharacterized protein n=1 Tax=Labeo rohita TaxID=84645 RepID=A0A498N0R9_LABRO|nr:hypothetical protein ROHU_008770 [Labeo rohita]RXN25753.1 hypothetical protein ROHU_021312 [Labeo rohita]